MKILESFNVLESFGFGTDEQGLFQEVSEVEMIDVIGGSCGGGGGRSCPYKPCSTSYFMCAPVGPGW